MGTVQAGTQLPPATLTSTNLPGQNIAVTTTLISTIPLVYEITATVQGSTYTERHTIGADGGGPLMTATDLQTALNGYRQAVADKVAWQASIAAAAAQVS
jgi:hypothetical protein